jgi:hypothetical protein
MAYSALGVRGIDNESGNGMEVMMKGGRNRGGGPGTGEKGIEE